MDKSLRVILDELAGKSPAPAAGAAAAVSLAQGAALGLKAIRITRSPGTAARVEALLAAAEEELVRVLDRGVSSYDEDCRAVESLIAHRTAGKVGSEELREAMRVPEVLLSLAADGLAAVETIATVVKRALVCEVGASAALMWAAAGIARSIVQNNVRWLGDEDDVLNRTEEAVERARRSYRAISGDVSAFLEGD